MPSNTWNHAGNNESGADLECKLISESIPENTWQGYHITYITVAHLATEL